jgi:hypothetical protein
MIRCTLAAAIVSVVLAGPALAAGGADGIWDCTEMGGDPLGIVTITDETYTFTKADGTPGEPGKIDYQGSDPAFAVLDGGLQTELTAIGAILEGGVLYVAVEHGRPVECTMGKPD